MKDRAEVVIIGGGIIGCSIAYQLAKKEDLIPGSYQINEIKASMDDGTVFTVQGDVLGPAEAALLRDGKIVKMIVSVQ